MCLQWRGLDVPSSRDQQRRIRFGRERDIDQQSIPLQHVGSHENRLLVQLEQSGQIYLSGLRGRRPSVGRAPEYRSCCLQYRRVVRIKQFVNLLARVHTKRSRAHISHCIFNRCFVFVFGFDWRNMIELGVFNPVVLNHSEPSWDASDVHGVHCVIFVIIPPTALWCV